MTRKKAVEITDTAKRAVIMKNRKLAKKAFTGVRGNMYEDQFVSLVRNLYGYSEKTIDSDIVRSWEKAYRQIQWKKS